MKWHHSIYGHNTIAILWAWHGIKCVELRGEDLWCYLNTFDPLVYENVCMITSLPTKRISAITQWVLPTRWRRKPAGTEITSLSPYAHYLSTIITVSNDRTVDKLATAAFPVLSIEVHGAKNEASAALEWLAIGLYDTVPYPAEWET